MKKNILNDLNIQQEEAVLYCDGPSIILAGAGSGKTRVLTHKVHYLISEKKVDPLSIMMVTFTNKAAGEMRLRVGQRLGFCGTFHSFGAYILRRHATKIGYTHSFVIYDESDVLIIIKDIIKKGNYQKKINPSFIRNKISSSKDNLISENKYKKYVKSSMDQVIYETYMKYQNKLKKCNALDFDDLIFYTVTLFQKYPDILEKYQDLYKYIFIDEYQDTNYSQYVLSKLLSKKNKNITVVGDFSQGIYSWRGADISNLEKFQNDFKNIKIFYLEKNYRSSQNILDFAYNVITKNNTHPILKLRASKNTGEDIVLTQLDNEQQEAMYITSRLDILSSKYSLDTIAILYRINAQSRIIEEALLHYAIPYVLIGGTRFYERKEIKDVLSYVRLLVNPDDEVSKERVMSIGKKRFEKFSVMSDTISKKLNKLETDSILQQILTKTGYLELYDKKDEDDFSRLENIKELRSVAVSFPNVNEFLEQVALVESEYSESEKQGKGKKGVKMMTLHQAKGLEFDAVFITGLEEGLLPHSKSIYDRQSLEEERRLFYVGITRAKDSLYITYTRRRFLFGRTIPVEASRFIRDCDEDEYISY